MDIHQKNTFFSEKVAARGNQCKNNHYTTLQFSLKCKEVIWSLAQGSLNNLFMLLIQYFSCISRIFPLRSLVMIATMFFNQPISQNLLVIPITPLGRLKQPLITEFATLKIKLLLRVDIAIKMWCMSGDCINRSAPYKLDK